MVYSIQELLYLWESYGVFDYALPFLLIFAIIFGILQYMKIFGNNKGIHIVIALALGGLAVRSQYMNQFYAELFPRLGIGVVIILSLLILIGMFIAEDERRYWFYGLGAIGVIIAIIILYQTFGYLGWTGLYGYLGGDSISWIILAVIMVGIIIAVATSTGSKEEKTSDKKAAVFDKLFGK